MDDNVLQDVKDGRVIQWREHKFVTAFLSDSYKRLGMYRKAYLVKDCSTDLEFEKFRDDLIKLIRANFCRVRLCPMCTWRRSLKIFGQTSKVMNYITNNHDYRYIFVTLTAKNVPGEFLCDELDKYFKAFHSLVRRKEFKRISKGWFRCLEVTHNWKRSDYHPHIHMVVAVPSTYFSNSQLYLEHGEWAALWRSCLGVDYNPMVNLRVVKLGKDGTFGSAVAEVAKYATKVNDYIFKIPKIEDSDDETFVRPEFYDELTDEAVGVLDSALANRRLVAFGGIFKTVHKMLNLDDAEDGDLTNTDNSDELRDDLNSVLVRYRWNVGFQNYIFVE